LMTASNLDLWIAPGLSLNPAQRIYFR